MLARSKAPTPQRTAAATPEQAPGVVRVQRVYGNPAIFELQGDRFRQQGPVPAGVDLVGAVLLELSPKGYALIELPTGAVWVDRMNLRFDSVVPNAYCGARMVTSAADSVTHGVRGVGEGCK